MLASGTAPELYAFSQQRTCEGKERCHWCGAPCGRLNQHDDPPPPLMRNARNLSSAKVPSSAWICTGCLLFRGRSKTVFFMDKKFQDRQCAMNHSWIIDERGAAAIRPPDYPRTQTTPDASEVYRYLLHPPTKRVFCLAVVTSGNQNLMHKAVTNYTSSGYTAASPIRFTFNNVSHTYSVQELELAARTGDTNGKEPGVRVLVNWLGPAASGVLKPESSKTGRPDEDQGQQQRRKV